VGDLRRDVAGIAAGRRCRVHHGPVRRNTIDREVHHRKVYNSLDIRLERSCSGHVRAGVRVVRVAGNPVMIEDGRWTSHYVTGP
jgi:hypothetical protein